MQLIVFSCLCEIANCSEKLRSNDRNDNSDENSHAGDCTANGSPIMIREVQRDMSNKLTPSSHSILLNSMFNILEAFPRFLKHLSPPSAYTWLVDLFNRWRLSQCGNLFTHLIQTSVTLAFLWSPTPQSSSAAWVLKYTYI